MTPRARLVIPRILLVVFCLTTFGCDQVSKQTASELLAPAPHPSPAPSSSVLPVIEGVLELRYAENRGIAFGLLHDLDHAALPWILGFVALGSVAAVALLWWRRRRSSLVEQTSYAAFAAGGAANGVDRLRDGSVIDFIHVSGWPIFNVADIAIAVGGVLFVLAAAGSGALRRKPKRLPSDPAPAQ